MKRLTLRLLLAVGLIAVVSGGTHPSSVDAQGIVDRIKRAAEAAKKAAEARKAAEGTKAEEPASPADTATAAGAVKSSATVAAEVLLTIEPGQQLQYVISPAGHHVAAIVLRGSREVVVHDGVDGPPFDRVLPDSIAFSPDGSRYAYIGQRGQDFVYMVDGKELLRLSAQTLGITEGSAVELPAPQFTANSRHVYFEATTRVPGRNAFVTPYMDGKPLPRTGSISVEPVFSADGERFAYLASDPNDPRSTVLIVDGKPAAWAGGDPRFTGDSRHLLTTTGLPGGGVEVRIDGKPWLRASTVRLHPAPVTNLVVAAVAATPQTQSWFLHIGNQKVPGSDCGAVGGVWFSPDGKHWAAALRTAAGTQFMMTNGKRGLDYQRVEGIAFLPDGTFVYKAVMRGEKQFIVVGDKESEAYQMIFPSGSETGVQRSVASGEDPFAAVTAGTHVGFVASRTPTAAGSVVVVDGKVVPVPNPTELTFSPDGARHAYASGKMPSLSQVTVDGVTHNGMILESRAGTREPKLTFSPDGHHIAYAAYSADQRLRGLSLNGKFIPYAQLPTFPAGNRTFSPDSRHLIWVAGFPRERSAVYVDGIRAIELQNGGQDLTSSDPTEPLSTKWRMGEDGVLTFIAQDGASLKRFRVTPGADTSVDTLAKMNVIQ